MELFKELNIIVIGSYDAAIIGCSKNEFIDASHIDSDCAVKLERKTTFNFEKLIDN